MAKRGHFSDAVAEALAKRVGYYCSFPGCNATTIGPSQESEKATSSTGMACHIVAAACGKGARRVKKDMSKGDRHKIGNGIWMCYKHGKLVDTDESLYTIELLQKWREIAEIRAQLEHQLGKRFNLQPGNLTGVSLAKQDIPIRLGGAENELIGNALLTSCVPLVWGESVSDDIRDLLVEIARNAISHGKASWVRLEIEPRVIRLSDDGEEFEPLTLQSHGQRSGGAETIRHVLQRHGHRVIIESRRSGKENLLTLALIRHLDDVPHFSPCSVVLTQEDYILGSSGKPLPKARGNCKETYYILPHFLSFSDIRILALALEREKIGVSDYVLVVRRFSSMSQMALDLFLPGARVIRLEE